MLMLGLRLIARQRNWHGECDTRRKTEPSFWFLFFFLPEIRFRVLWPRSLSVTSTELQLQLDKNPAFPIERIYTRR